MRSTLLLLKNAFKSAWHTKIQIIGLSLLVAFLSALISILSATSECIVVKNDLLNKESNLRDSILNFESSERLNKDSNVFTKAEIPIQDNQELLQQYLVNKLSQENRKDIFDWSRTEARQFVGLKNLGEDLNIKAVTKTKAIDSKEATVDKLYVTTGNNFSSDIKKAEKQVIINENFANFNKIKIGDVIRLEKDFFGNTLKVADSKPVNNEQKNSDKWLKFKQSITDGTWETNFSGFAWLKVVGFGTSADFNAPIINETTIIPDAKKNLIAYVAPSLFGLKEDNKTGFYICDQASSKLYGDEFGREIYFSLKEYDGFNYEDLSKKYKEYTTVNNSESKDIKNLYFSNNNKEYKYINRINLFNKVINSYQIASFILLLSTLFIALFALLIMLKKQADITKPQMGCLKALGYRKRELVNNFAAVPIIASAIGCITGYLLSLGFEPIIVNIFSQFFTITFGDYTFSLFSLINTLFVGFVSLLIISFICISFVMRKPALKLLSGFTNERHSKIQELIKKPFSKARFNTKLTVAVFSASFARFVGTFITMLLATMLLSATTIMPKILIDNKTATFDGLNYSNINEYTAPEGNNPMSFYKTYNPKNDDKDWGFKSSTVNEYIAPNVKQDVYSQLPYKNDKIDTQKIYDELYSGDINSEFYEQNIPTSAGAGNNALARLGYLNYSNLSINYLNALEKSSINLDWLTGGIVLEMLQNQWPDWVTLKNEIKIFNSSSKSISDIKAFTNVLVWFYNKYDSGIKMTFNSDSVMNDGTINKTKAKDHFKNIFSNYDYFDETLFDNVKLVISQKDDESDTISGIDLFNFDVNTQKEEELKALNTKIALWIAMMFDKRISAAVLQTSYSRAPYYVQENIKKAIINKTNYNINFNIVAYDPKKDTLGTMLNARYKDVDFKVYGLSKDDFKNMISFNSDEFSDMFDKKNNLIINRSLAKKLKLKIGQEIDTNIFKKSLADKNNKEVDFDENSFGFKDVNNYKTFTPNSALPYQSTNDKNFTSLLGIDPVKIDGKETSSSTSAGSTGKSEIHKSFLNGEIKTKEFNTNEKFKIVGIQDSYGKPQAWTSNETSNEILGYNKVQSSMFSNWFSIQNCNNKDFKDYVFGEKKDISKFLTKEEKYSDFLVAMNNASKEDKKIFKKINQIFLNSYPVFNYKYSKDSTIYELTNGAATGQPFGDFSSIGLNGNFEIGENGEIGSYVQGAGTRILFSAMPTKDAQKILEQITEIVNLITIVFIVLAMVMSLIIILLVTSIIIYENSKFIATMKILGYQNLYVVWQILKIYVWAIFISFLIGFGLSLLALRGGINYMATNTSWILPFRIHAYMPFAVLLILLVIYGLTFFISLKQIKKITPISAISTTTN